MTREQAIQEVKRLEGERISLSLSTDFFSYSEGRLYDELCSKINALKAEFDIKRGETF